MTRIKSCPEHTTCRLPARMSYPFVERCTDGHRLGFWCTDHALSALTCTLGLLHALVCGGAEEGAGGSGVMVGNAAEELALEDDAVVVAAPGAEHTPAGAHPLPPPPAEQVRRLLFVHWRCCYCMSDLHTAAPDQ